VTETALDVVGPRKVLVEVGRDAFDVQPSRADRPSWLTCHREPAASSKSDDEAAVTARICAMRSPRPGLVGCLLIGVTAAKTLAWLEQAARRGQFSTRPACSAASIWRGSPELAAIALVVSGGHSSLFLVAIR